MKFFCPARKAVVLCVLLWAVNDHLAVSQLAEAQLSVEGEGGAVIPGDFQTEAVCLGVLPEDELEKCGGDTAPAVCRVDEKVNYLDAYTADFCLVILGQVSKTGYFPGGIVYQGIAVQNIIIAEGNGKVVAGDIGRDRVREGIAGVEYCRHRHYGIGIVGLHRAKKHNMTPWIV